MSLFDTLTAFDVWHMENINNPGERIQGQFVAENVTEEVGSNYSRTNSLNRSAPIAQFLNGNADTLSFQVRLFARDALFTSVEDDLTTLKKFARRDKTLGHPPILHFWIGDGHIELTSCYITGLTGISYDNPTNLGAIRGVTLTVNLEKYKEFNFTESAPAETRYHRARTREYYELLCYQEYGNPNLGDIIRKRHPTKPTFGVGEIIKLPSIEAIRKDRVEPKSIALSTSFGKKTTPQRTLRLELLDKRNQVFYSHIITE